MTPIINAILLAFFLLLALPVDGHAADCTSPGLRTLERPPGDGGPTEITTSFIVADILGVDDVSQKIELDLIATFRWQDDRLASYVGCQFGVTEVWFPRMSLLNSSQLALERVNARNRIMVGEHGEILYRQRYTGTISTYHNLRSFPFDRHDFDIEVATLLNDSSQIGFVADPDGTWISERLNVEGWDISGIDIFSEDRFLRQANAETTVLTLRIMAERDADYYIYRVLLPLILVVAMSWVVFWVPPERFEFQIGIGATSMLTVIAFNLTVGNNLPTLGYLTLLDTMIIWAILLVFLSIAEALTAGLLEMNGRGALARKLDRYSRVAFPTLLFVGWMILIGIV